MNLYFVRHGKTEWNLEKRVQGIADTELLDEGIEQAKKAKEDLKDVNIDLIVCSPLKRTRQTAAIINEERNLPIIYDERVIERDFGEFEGLTRSEFDFESFWSYKKNIKYEKAENIRDFFKRIFDFIDSLKKDYPDKNILIVMHGGVSIAVKCYFEGIPDNDTLAGTSQSHCETVKYTLKDK